MRRVIKKIYSSLILSIIVLFCLVGLCVAVALSPSGLKITLFVLSKSLPGKLSYQHASGLIVGPINIENLSYQNKNIKITIKKLHLQWQLLNLLHNNLHIENFSANDVTIVSSASNQNFKPFEPHLPITLQIDHGTIDNLQFNQQKIAQLQIKNTLINHKITVNLQAKLATPYQLTTALQITGSWQNYHITLMVENKHFNWTGTGQGNLDQVQLHFARSKLLEGSAEGQLNLSWYPLLSWNVHLLASHINLQQINKRWPAQFNIKLNSRGTHHQQHTQFSMVANITMPETELNIDVKKDTQWHGHWDVNVHNLGVWLPNSSGSLVSQGTINGTLQHPQTKGELSTNQLTWNKITVKVMNAHWNIDFSDQHSSSININAQQFRDHQLNLKNLHLTAIGKIHGPHQITADFNLHNIAVQLHANGQWQNHTWQGFLEKLSLNMPSLQHNRWYLKRPSAITLSQNKITFQQLCLADNTNANLCLNGSWQANAPWHIALVGNQINSNLLTEFWHIQSDSKMTIAGSLQGKGQHLSQGALKLQLTPGTLRIIKHHQAKTLNFIRAELNAALNQSILKANLQMQFNHGDLFNAAFELPHFNLADLKLSQESLRGNVAVKINNLNLLNQFIPKMQIPKGTLQSNLSLHGTLAKPILAGKVSLLGGDVIIPGLNLKLSNIQLSASSQDHVIHYTGSAYVKGRPIHIAGVTQLNTNNFPTKLTITADKILLVNTSEFQIYTSPHITISLQGYDLKISGTIAIPEANIRIEKFNNTVKLPTNEVEIIDGKKKSPQKIWHTYLHVDLVLGKQVKLYYQKAQGALSGAITILQSPQQPMTATGNIYVKNGTYNLNGQILTIKPGSAFIFTANPISNPKINIRAFRAIRNIQPMSNSKIIVGIHLQGYLRNPRFVLYSIPVGLSQADILSYLVLGYVPTFESRGALSRDNISLLVQALSSLNIGIPGTQVGLISEIRQGLGLTELGVESQTILSVVGNQIGRQNSFVIGRYLGKKFYIRYSIGISGQGLYQTNNVDLLQLQYLLSHHWILQVSTNTDSSKNSTAQLGEMGTGGDILYTFSRN